MRVFWLCVTGLPALAWGQQQRTAVADSVTVYAAAEPVVGAEGGRVASTVDVQAHPLLVEEPAGYLREDATVDIESRGGAGVQSDVAVRGGTFEQTLVLLNGFRINDAETSHFNLDVPVPVRLLGGIAVEHGAGSTLYGSDAVAGTVDLQTITPVATSLKLRAGVGSYGGNEAGFDGAVLRGRVSEVLSGERDYSDGFIADRDYRSEELGSETRVRTPLGESDVLLGVSDRAFGAAQFYGNYPSYERTKGWFGAGTQGLGERTSVAVAYRRHTDEFVLFRQNPAAYENNHGDESWQALLRRQDGLGNHWMVRSGLDFNLDQIQSNSLGRHGRNRGAGYGDVTWSGRRGVLEAGLREEVIGGYGVVNAPGVSGAVEVGRGVRVHGSVGYGFRLPTYVDKYYNDPTTIANPGLKPESGWSYDGGVHWEQGSRLTVDATGFASRQTDAIDYVRAGGKGPYQARNLDAVDLTGAEIAAGVRFSARQSLRLAYTGITGAQSALGGLQSRYLANYPAENASAEYLAGWRQVAGRLRVGAAERLQRPAYGVVDLALARETGVLRPYVRMTNLTNTGYEEVQGVRVQGRGFVGGVEVVLRGGK